MRRASSRRSSPRSASARTRCEPRKPLPPVTRVFAIGRMLDRRARAAVRHVIELASERRSEQPPSSPTRPRTCPEELVAEQRHPRDQPLRHARRRAAAREPRSPSTYDDFYERLRAQRRGRDHLAALGRRLHRRSTSRCSPTGRDIVSIHISAGISGTCEARALQARERADRRRQAAASGSTCSTAAPAAAARGCWRWSRPRGRARGRRRRRGARPRPSARARRLKMWFAIDTLEYLRKGGRIGAAQAWLGSALTDQADPDPRGGDHPGRAGAHPPPRLRAPGRAARSERKDAGADTWVVQHIQDPETARAAGRRVPADLRHATRSSSRRSAR